MAYVDWEKERVLITGNYQLSSQELEYGYRVLEYAKTLYPIGSDIPGSIYLYNKKGFIFHTIKTKDASSTTAEVRLPPKFKTVDILAMITFTAGAIALFCVVRKCR